MRKLTWTQSLENESETILQEWRSFESGLLPEMFLNVCQDSTTHNFFFLSNKKFTTLFAEKFKKTLKIVGQIPRLRAAGFITTLPNTYVKPHRGQYGVLRTHLGLAVPEENWLETHENRIPYVKGKCLSFHDYDIHSGMNSGDSKRTSLVVDVWLSFKEVGNPLRLLGAQLLDKTLLKRNNFQESFRLQRQVEKEIQQNSTQ